MRWTRIAVALLIAAFAEAPPGSGQARSGLSPRGAFIRQHRCEVVARLDAIHRRGPVETSRDRFIVVALRDRPMHYVQCIFQPFDTVMLCEASSGAYGKTGFRLQAQSQAALRALQYAQATEKRISRAPSASEILPRSASPPT
ncbi:hypothetical protein [Methylobacterium sp. CM6246]